MFNKLNFNVETSIHHERIRKPCRRAGSPLLGRSCVEGYGANPQVRLDYSEIFTAITEERMKNVFFKARERFCRRPPRVPPIIPGKTHENTWFLDVFGHISLASSAMKSYSMTQ